jgi:hypothetical protein
MSFFKLKEDINMNTKIQAGGAGNAGYGGGRGKGR